MPSLRLAAITAMLVCGCVYSKALHSDYDPFLKRHSHKMSLGRHWGGSGNFDLYLVGHEPEEAQPSYQVEVVYHSAFGWMFIQAGRSLGFLLGDEPLWLESRQGSSGQRDVAGGLGTSASIAERAVYDITAAQIDRLAEAERLKCRVCGSKGYQGFELGPAAIDQIRKFRGQVIVKEGNEISTEPSPRRRQRGHGNPRR
jgi:hypothetical protein